jgi:hypothetical protein
MSYFSNQNSSNANNQNSSNANNQNSSNANNQNSSNANNQNSNNNNTSNLNASAIQYINAMQKQKIQQERDLFGNIFGFIPDAYIKYFNIFVVESITTLFFTFIYYYFMVLDFDKYYFVTGGYHKKHFSAHKFWTALFMSINFQTTTAYVDLKVKSFLLRFIINLQLVTTVAILFFFAIK